MADVHQLSRADARRIAVRAQLLTADRPTDLVEVVRQVSLLQLEPTSAVAPSAELVLWSRLGAGYDRQELWDAVDELRLIELHQALRVPEDMALYRAEMADCPGHGRRRPAVEAGQPPVGRRQRGCRQDILELPAHRRAAAAQRAAGHLRPSRGGRRAGTTTATSR